MSQTSIDIQSQQRIHFLNYLQNDFIKTFDSMNHLNLDLSDFGNALGQVLRQEFCDKEFVSNIDGFINGFRHGLDLNQNESPFDKSVFVRLAITDDSIHRLFNK